MNIFTNKKIKFIFSNLLVIALICCQSLLIDAAESNGNNIVISIEAFTLDYGFVLNPTIIEYNSSDSISTIINKAYGGDKVNNGTEAGNYISSIAFDTDFLNINSEISDVFDEKNISPSPTVSKEGWLSEFDFTRFSGWILIVNNKISDTSISDYKPSAGDVVRLCFSIYGYGADLALNTSDSGLDSETNVFQDTNRDKLLKAMAHYYLNSDFEMDFYVEGVITDLNSEQEEIEDAYSFLIETNGDVEDAFDDVYDEDEIESDDEEFDSEENIPEETTTQTTATSIEPDFSDSSDSAPDFAETTDDSNNDSPILTTSPELNDLYSSSYVEYKNNIPKAESAPTGVSIQTTKFLIFFLASGLAILAGFVKKKISIKNKHKK